jgi:hypothetical protein
MKHDTITMLSLCLLILMGCLTFIPTEQSTSTVQWSTPSATTIPPSATLTFTPPPPTLTSTITPMPTYSPDEAELILAEMMQTNGNCSVPCFWGIIPGQTPIDEAVGFLTALSRSFGDDEIVQAVGNDTIYSFSFNFYKESEIMIYVSLTRRNNGLVNLFARPDSGYYMPPDNVWLGFRPETVLKKFGAPSRVGFYIVTGAEGHGYYGMLIYYSQTVIEYIYPKYISYPMIKSGNTKICPLTDGASWFEYWLGSDFRNEVPPYKYEVALNDVTSMTEAGFYALMIGKPEDACFTVDFSSYAP